MSAGDPGPSHVESLILGKLAKIERLLSKGDGGSGSRMTSSDGGLRLMGKELVKHAVDEVLLCRSAGEKPLKGCYNHTFRDGSMLTVSALYSPADAEEG